MKKILSLVIALAMILSMVPGAFAAEDQLPLDEEVVAEPIWLEAGENFLTIPANSTVRCLGRFNGLIVSALGEGLVIDHMDIYTLGEEATEFEFVQPVEWSPGEIIITNNSAEDRDCVLTIFYPLGSVGNPEALELGYNSLLVSAGAKDRYYTWTAEEDGTLAFEVYSESGWFYVVNNITAGKYGDFHYYDDEIPVYYEELEVSAGDEIQILVNTYDPETPWEAPEGEMNFYVSFIAPEGSASNPAWLEPGENNLTIAAGATKYYAGRFGDLTMSASGEGFVVEHNGETYVLGAEPVEFVCVQEGWDPCLFIVTNNGEAEAECNLTLVFPEGSVENPADLAMGETTVEVAAGSQGYYISWIAEEDGVLSVEMTGDESWFYNVNNMTTYQYGDNHYSDDEVPVACEKIEVSAGDEIQILVNTYNPETPWDAPAGKVSFKVTFSGNGAEDVVVGDANGDSVVNIRDAMLIAQYANQAIGEDKLDLAACDFNGDGVVNIRDAMKIATMG